MEVIRTLIREVLTTVPGWALAAIAAGLAAVAAGTAAVLLVSRLRLKSRLKTVAENPGLAGPLVRDRYSAEALLQRSGLIENVARSTDPALLGLIGMDDIWIESLKRRKRRSDLRRVLAYAPERGLFQCFLLSLEKRSFGPMLLSWLSQSEDYLYLRKLALSGRGEPFGGKDALELFKDHLEQIRELTGDPEWASRYFAYKILLHDRDERSQRALWDGFLDPHPLVRTSIVREITTEETDRLYESLSDRLLHDPAFEVRQAAWLRIHTEFPNRYRLDPEELGHDAALHALELLRIDSKADEDFAFRFLDQPDLELRSAAARFLERVGALDRLCLQADRGDRESFDRSSRLLKNASEVNVTSFLGVIERTHNPGTLSLCADVLREIGRRSLITELARKVFRLVDGQGMTDEEGAMYDATLESVSKRGNDEALRLLDRELVRRKDEPEPAARILSHMPARSGSFSLATLFLFLKDPSFPQPDALRQALLRMPVSQVLPELMSLIKSGRETYPHAVRLQALKLLGEMKLSYCLQTFLENLPIFPLDEAKDFAAVLADYPKDIFTSKVEKLLDSPDSQIRSTLIACLPVTEIKEFLPSIRKSLKDADPDVRIASVWALVDFEDTRSINQAFALLRDPVERVRVEASRALGSKGSDETLDKLKALLDDENEVVVVKQAAVEGLEAAPSLKAVDILVDCLESGVGPERGMVQALSSKTGKKEIAHLVERFKDASQKVRDSLTEAFKKMQENGEEALVELLHENIASLQPFVVEILEMTGYVDAVIRRLKHRDTTVRREAAHVLSLLGTESAFRGMVLAARDPDEEVRVQVIKALEKLETDEGKNILTALEGDPDRRIRKYTHWALERLKAKAL